MLRIVAHGMQVLHMYYRNKKRMGGCCRFMFTTNHSGHSVRCCFSSGKSHEKTHNSLRSEMNAGTFGKKQEETSSCEDRRISSPFLSCTTACNNQPFDPVNCQLNHVVWLLSTCLYQQGLSMLHSLSLLDWPIATTTKTYLRIVEPFLRNKSRDACVR